MCEPAAASGRLDILRLLAESDILPNERATYHIAIACQEFEVLKWLLKECGVQWRAGDARAAAGSDKNYQQVLDWLRKNGLPQD
jgi:hypothetical protein